MNAISTNSATGAPLNDMLRKAALVCFYLFVVVTSFMVTDSLIERGLAATLLAIYRFLNP
jgi:hypothetical protein